MLTAPINSTLLASRRAATLLAQVAEVGRDAAVVVHLLTDHSRDGLRSSDERAVGVWFGGVSRAWAFVRRSATTPPYRKAARVCFDRATLITDQLDYNAPPSKSPSLAPVRQLLAECTGVVRRSVNREQPRLIIANRYFRNLGPLLPFVADHAYTRGFFSISVIDEASSNAEGLEAVSAARAALRADVFIGREDDAAWAFAMPPGGVVVALSPFNKSSCGDQGSLCLTDVAARSGLRLARVPVPQHVAQPFVPLAAWTAMLDWAACLLGTTKRRRRTTSSVEERQTTAAACHGKLQPEAWLRLTSTPWPPEF